MVCGLGFRVQPWSKWQHLDGNIDQGVQKIDLKLHQLQFGLALLPGLLAGSAASRTATF